MQFRVIGHEPYIHVEPDDGGKNPPPWWLLGLVVRVVPSMRRKLRAAALAVGAGKLESVPAEWVSNHRPRLRREIEQHAAVDLAALDDAALFRHLEDLKAFYARCLQLHFTLFIPHTVGLYELAVACEELLGWDLQRDHRVAAGTVEHLDGVDRRTRCARSSRRPAARDTTTAGGQNAGHPAATGRHRSSSGGGTPSLPSILGAASDWSRGGLSDRGGSTAAGGGFDRRSPERRRAARPVGGQSGTRGGGANAADWVRQATVRCGACLRRTRVSASGGQRAPHRSASDGPPSTRRPRSGAETGQPWGYWGVLRRR